MPAEEQVIAANDSVAYLNVIVTRNEALKGSAIAVFQCRYQMILCRESRQIGKGGFLSRIN